MSIRLPEALWGAARVEQDARLEHDPWDDLLATVKGAVYPTPDSQGQEERVASRVLISEVLHLGADRATNEQAKRLANCMRGLGWAGPQKMRIMIGGEEMDAVRGYSRPIGQPSPPPKWEKE